MPQITPLQALQNLAAIAAGALLNRQDRIVAEASIEVLNQLINPPAQKTDGAV